MFRVPWAPSVVLLALAAPLAAGCAHDTSAADRHAREMRESMAKLEADRDRVPLTDDDAPRGEARKPQDGGVTLPVPRTIQLGGPESDGEDDDPNAPTARPKIELSGPGTSAPAPRPSSRSRTREGGRETRIEMLGPASDGAAAEPAPPPPPEPSAKQAPAPDEGAKTPDPKKAPRSAPRDRARGSDPKAAPKETR